jgi:hypothetical protein
MKRKPYPKTKLQKMLAVPFCILVFVVGWVLIWLDAEPVKKHPKKKSKPL